MSDSRPRSANRGRWDRIRLYDTTLRDGEQTPGVAFSADQKVRMAVAIANAGCRIIDLGFPLSAVSNAQALKRLLDARAAGDLPSDLDIVVMARANLNEISSTRELLERSGHSAQSVTLLVFTAASPLHCRFKLADTLMSYAGIRGIAPEDVPLPVLYDASKSMWVGAIRHARACGFSEIEAALEDASRTPLEQLLDLFDAGLGAGATRINFADTVGCFTPERVAAYSVALRRRFPDTEIVNHFHNDCGLATINVVTAVLNGVTTCSVTVNGIGERAGNAAMHEVVSALRFLYDQRVEGFDYEALGSLGTLVEECSGLPIPVNEPIVGQNAFSHESGIHAHGVAKHPAVYEFIPASAVGAQRRIAYGKHSGVHSIEAALASGGRALSTAATDPIFSQRVLEAVKAAREARIDQSHTEAFVRQYHDTIRALGLSREEVLAVAERIAAEIQPRTINA